MSIPFRRQQSLYRTWLDRADLSHQVVFSDSKWIDLYNHDTVSVSPFTLYNNYPDRGGQLSLTGNFLQLEESPGNYYLFIIKELDSLSLELEFNSAGTHYSFISQQAMDEASKPVAKDSLQ